MVNVQEYNPETDFSSRRTPVFNTRWNISDSSRATIGNARSKSRIGE